MKRYSILIGLALSVAVLIASCSPSPQKKAEALIKDSMQKTLILPDTYQPVETELDSAFSPRHSPEFMELVFDVYKKAMEMSRLEEQMKSARSAMAIWGGSYMTSFARQNYNDAKEEYAAAEKKYDLLSSQVEKAGKKMGEMTEKGNEFIGFRARHSYRAQNNAGNVLLDEKYFLFDKDITQVVAQWSKEEIEIYTEFLEMIQDQYEAQEE